MYFPNFTHDNNPFVFQERVSKVVKFEERSLGTSNNGLKTIG